MYSTHNEEKCVIAERHILTLIKKLVRKIINLRLVMMLEYQNIKGFLQNAMLQTGLKKICNLKC